MLGSTIVSKARKLANDTDSVNPFHTDADCYEELSDWLHEVAIEFGYPQKQQAISFSANAGGAAGTKNLDNDLSKIIIAVWEPTGKTPYLLIPRTEAAMAAENPDWRNLAAGAPSYYIVQDAITAQAVAIGPLHTITTDKPVDTAGTLRLYGLQMPAIVTAGTNSPVFQTPFHKSAVYYLAAHMLMPRDKQAANYYLGLHQQKLRRCKTLVKDTVDPNAEIWVGSAAGVPGKLSL